MAGFVAMSERASSSVACCATWRLVPLLTRLRVAVRNAGVSLPWSVLALTWRPPSALIQEVPGTVASETSPTDVFRACGNCFGCSTCRAAVREATQPIHALHGKPDGTYR
jgi:hypothetical protein